MRRPPDWKTERRRTPRGGWQVWDGRRTNGREAKSSRNAARISERREGTRPSQGLDVYRSAHSGDSIV